MLGSDSVGLGLPGWYRAQGSSDMSGAGGALFAAMRWRLEPVDAIYFAVTALATGGCPRAEARGAEALVAGLMAPPTDDISMVAVGCWALMGGMPNPYILNGMPAPTVPTARCAMLRLCCGLGVLEVWCQ